MKRFFIPAVLLLCGLVLGVGLCFLLGRLDPQRGISTVSKAPATSPAAEVPCENTMLIQLTYDAVAAIRDQDFDALSAMVHPEYGLTFSPYSHVNLSSARCFSPAEVSAFGRDRHRYVWGVYDGSGEPIELSVSDYFQSFVFDRDFTEAPIIGVDRVLYSGNTLENVTDVFTDAHFVELCDPGAADNNLDWATLRLVFEDYDGELYLSAIIHSQWTI